MARQNPKPVNRLSEKEIKEIKTKFLKVYSRTGVLTYSAERAGSTVVQIRKWLSRDEAFAKKFDQMQEKFVDTLEMVAVQRAMEKSDTLLLALLKANRPKKYRENVKMEADVNEKKTVTLVFSKDEIGDMPNFAKGETPSGGTAEETET